MNDLNIALSVDGHLIIEMLLNPQSSIKIVLKYEQMKQLYQQMPEDQWQDILNARHEHKKQELQIVRSMKDLRRVD